VKEDTKSNLGDFAFLSFIGGFFFPPLFVVGIFLLLPLAFDKKKMAGAVQSLAKAAQSYDEHAKRIANDNRLRLISSYLLGPIQAKLKVAIEVRSIAEQLENDPKLKAIFDSIKLTSPTDSSTAYQPLDIDRELAELASLLPMNAALASKVLQTQKDCVSELRRIRERLQADSVLLQQFRTVKMSNVCENFDAFKAFGSLGGSATNQTHSLIREVDAFQNLLATGPQVCVTRDVAADKLTVTPRKGALLPIPEGLVSKVAKNHSGQLKSHPVELSKATNSHHQLAHVSPRPTPSKQAPLFGQQEKLEPQSGSIDDPMLQEALDAYEDSRREEREASYELLRKELSAFQAEAAFRAEDWASRSWQDELGGTVFREARIQPGANEELLLQLRRNGVKKLYHFTDRQNIQSIIRNGGLYSWDLCETSNLVISRPGGSALSRQLDCRKGLQRYVRLGFARDHPMMYTAIGDGRISDPVVLEIDLDVVRLSDVLYSDRNAVASGANVGPGLDALRGIHFDLIQRGKWRTEEEKGFYQAEVLIRDAVPGYLIRHEGRLIRTRPDFDSDADIPF